MMSSHKRHNQSGVAIITVLLMVALATITVVSMSTRLRLDIRRSANQQALQQAKTLALAGEKFAAATLMRDKKDALNGKTDSLDDEWAQSLPPIPVEQSTIRGCVFDLQGRFNLNNLVDSNGKADLDEFERFKRLLNYLTIDSNKAAAVLDWIDTDSEAQGSDGAESDYYSGLEHPYRPANRYMASISELKMVKGFAHTNEDEKADYELLLAHISALPGVTKINVNTATPAVIAALDERLLEDAEKISRWQDPIWELYPECENIFDINQLLSKAQETTTLDEDKNPYETTTDFIKTSSLSSLESEEEQQGVEKIKEGLSVQSDYFQIRIEVETGEVSLVQFSLVKRSKSGANTVLQRSRNVF